MLADILPRDTFLDVLELAYERGDLLTGAFALPPYYGTNPFPEWVLHHPRYHAIWSQSELVNLAEARRSNGWEDGLPKFPVSED